MVGKNIVNNSTSGAQIKIQKHHGGGWRLSRLWEPLLWRKEQSLEAAQAGLKPSPPLSGMYDLMTPQSLRFLICK